MRISAYEFCRLDIEKGQSFLRMWKLRLMNKLVVVNNSLSIIIGDGTPPLKDSITHTLEARFVLFFEQHGSRFDTRLAKVNNKLSRPFHQLTRKHLKLTRPQLWKRRNSSLLSALWSGYDWLVSP